MGIKSVKDNKDVPTKIKYPCLMESITSSKVVLFRNEYVGVVVFSDEVAQLGRQKPGFGNWNMENFRPFTGTITLSNDD